jgi:hypothetical protein
MNTNCLEVQLLSAAAPSSLRPLLASLVSLGPRLSFDPFASLHQLKVFPISASMIAPILRKSRSNTAVESQLLAARHLRNAAHCNRFAFLHQLQHFLNPVFAFVTNF